MSADVCLPTESEIHERLVDVGAEGQGEVVRSRISPMYATAPTVSA